METIGEIIAAYFHEGTRRAVLSNPAAGAAYKKIVITALDGYMQVEKFTDKQAFHENMPFEQARAFIEETLQGQYRQFNAWDTE